MLRPPLAYLFFKLCLPLSLRCRTLLRRGRSPPLPLRIPLLTLCSLLLLAFCACLLIRLLALALFQDERPLRLSDAVRRRRELLLSPASHEFSIVTGHICLTYGGLSIRISRQLEFFNFT